MGGRDFPTHTEPAPAARPYGRRADAERNRESILDHATRLLVDDPAVGMGEMAGASGIGRATLYRHFPTREELIQAIADRALDETERAIVASRLEEGTALEALRRLVAALLEIGDRYRFLLAQATTQSQAAAGGAQAELRVADRLAALFERGGATGELSRYLPPAWMTTMVGVVVLAAAQRDLSGCLDQDRAIDIVMETLLYGLTGGPAAHEADARG